MRITPLDVRKQEFRKVVRGLDADEVYAFLATVADEYEAVLTDNKQLRDKVIELDERVGEYRNMERTLRDTLLTAERVMTEARQNARKEAELILRDAQVKAASQTADISRQVEALRAQLRELRGHRDSFLARLQSLSEAQIGLVESYRKDFRSEDERVPDGFVGVEDPPTLRAEPAAGPSEPDRSSPASETVAEETPSAAASPAFADVQPVQPVQPVQSIQPVEESAAAPSPYASSEETTREDHSADDAWRDYRVGAVDAGAGGEPTPTSVAMPADPTAVAPTAEPAPPVQTGVENFEPAVEEVVHTLDALAHEIPAGAGADAADEALSFEAPAAEVPTGPAADPVVYPTGPSDAGAASEDEVYPITWEQEPSAEAVAAPAMPSGEPVAAEHAQGDDGQSRWSLSRFTRGLAGF